MKKRKKIKNKKFKMKQSHAIMGRKSKLRRKQKKQHNMMINLIFRAFNHSNSKIINSSNHIMDIKIEEDTVRDTQAEPNIIIIIE